jgi:hypothetical protein
MPERRGKPRLPNRETVYRATSSGAPDAPNKKRVRRSAPQPQQRTIKVMRIIVLHAHKFLMFIKFMLIF